MRYWRTTIDPFQLFRCLMAGGPNLAVPFDVEDPPPQIMIQPTITSWSLPSAPPATLDRPETFDEALDRLSFVNKVARAELEDSVFTLRWGYWLTNGHQDNLFKRECGFWKPHEPGEHVEPIATNKRIIDGLALGFSAAAMVDEEKRR